MNYQDEAVKLADVLQKAKDVVIVTHERPNGDSIGASLALYLGLLSLGKKVVVACPDPVTVDLSSFVGANKIVTEIGKKNFVISLDYVEGSIEKVSYNIEGNKFNLVIEPRVGFDTFSRDKVHFTHAGTPADIIIAIDTIHLGGLKKLYEDDKELYASKPVINIDRHPNNVQYGTTNIVDPQASSSAELVWNILRSLGVELTQDMASNLLNALYNATNNFTTVNVTPAAFELAADCAKRGAKRFRRMPQQPSEEVPTQEAVSTPSPEIGMPQAAPQAVKQPQKAQEAPADWLKPKIFKSSNLL